MRKPVEGILIDFKTFSIENFCKNINCEVDLDIISIMVFIVFVYRFNFEMTFIKC